MSRQDFDHGISFLKFLSSTIGVRNPAITSWGNGRLSHFLQGFIYTRWLAGFLNHQQYHWLGKFQKIDWKPIFLKVNNAQIY